MRSLHLPFKISTLVILFILLFSSQSTFAQSGWQWQNPLPQGNDLNVVKFLNINTGFAAGEKGSLVKTTNGGINWSVVNFNFDNQPIEFLCVIDSNIVYAASSYYYNQASIFKTTNGGNNWVLTATITPSLECLTFVNANTGFAVVNDDQLKKTTDGGFTWSLSYTLSSAIVEVSFITEQVGFFTVREYAAPSNNMWRTTNQGATWQPCIINTSTEQCRKMSFINSTTGYVVRINTSGAETSILKTTDAGANWVQVSIFPVPVTYVYGFCFEMKADGYGYLGFKPEVIPNTNTEVIYRTNNFGLNWSLSSTIPTKGSRNYWSMFNFPIFNFSSSEIGFYVANRGVILKTTNSGINWFEKSTSLINLPLANINFPDNNTGYIFGSGGTFLKTTNTGINWNYSKISNLDFHTSFFLNNQTGYVGANNSRLLKTTSGGNSWDTIIVNSSNTSISSIYFITNETGFLTNNYSIYKTSNGGVNWMQFPCDGEMNGIHFINNNTGFAFSHVFVPPFSAWSRIYRTNNGGDSWSVLIELGPSLESIKFISNDTGYAVYNSKVVKSINGGVSWFNVLNTRDAAEVKTLAPNIIYSGSYKSTNGGANWTFFKTRVQSIKSVLYLNENTGFIVGGSGAGILKTTDGGEIISAINPISSNIPEGFSLKQNCPNPFNPTTKINFDLKNSAFAMLRVFDITGREVRTLVNEKLSTGSYSYDFNAVELPSGVYFYQLQADGFIETKKMILLK